VLSVEVGFCGGDAIAGELGLVEGGLLLNHGPMSFLASAAIADTAPVAGDAARVEPSFAPMTPQWTRLRGVVGFFAAAADGGATPAAAATTG